MKRYNILYVLTAFLTVSSLAVSCQNGQSEEDDDNGPGNTIVETGYLEAVNSKSFVLPRIGRWGSMRITGLVEHGSLVQAGDSVIQFDPSDIQKYITDAETRLESQVAALEKLKISQANTRSSEESSMKTQEANFELKKIQMEAVRFESERTQRIRELEFRQAEITLAKEKRKMELSELIREKELYIREVEMEQTKRDIENTYRLLDQLTLYTPISGVFEIMYNRRQGGGLIKVGDNVYAGNKIAMVPDLKWMKVITSINETDILKIHEGQKVAVRLDAMNNVVFDGEITYIGKLCHQKDDTELKQKVFDVEVTLLDSDERLKPGMTVSCEFL